MKIDYKELSFKFTLFSWRTVFSFVRLVVFNAPLTIMPMVLYRGGYVEDELTNELGLNTTDLLSNDVNKTYMGDMAQVVINLLNASCLLYYILPFILCYKMATPLMNMHQTVLKHSDQLEHLSTPSIMILLPIFCFIFVALENFMMTLAILANMEEEHVGSSSLPFVKLVTFGNAFTCRLVFS